MRFYHTVFIGLLLSMHAHAESIIFSDDFEGGPGTLRSQWERKRDNGGEIVIGEEKARGKVVCISRDNRNGLTLITHRLPPINGSVRIEAEIQADQVMTGASNFKGGQFHAVVIVNGKEVAWPKSDFDGSFGWIPMAFDVFDITPSMAVLLRIGLQQGKGKVCIDNVKIIKTD